MRLRTGGIWALAAGLAALVAQPAAARGKPAAAEAAPAVSAVAQDYEPRPAIWLLSDSDTRIYLFGTTHMLPPGFKWRSTALDAVAKEADELVVETTDEGTGEVDSAVLRQIMLDTPVPLLDRVPKKHRKALKAAVKRSGLPLEGLAMMRTWMAGLVVGIGIQLGEWGVADPKEAPGVEDSLEAEFRAAGKPISSVESPEAGLDAFNALTEAEQIQLLIEGLEGEREVADDNAKGDHLWAQGRFEEAYDSLMEEFPPVLYEGLVRKRNAAWTQWLQDRLDRPGTVLFAVGAAHLAGADSVQKMLAARGLEAKRFD